MDDYIKRSDVLRIVSARLKPCNALIGDLCNACEDVYRMVELIPSADVQPVGYTLEECGDYLLFLWMENILTDAEYNRAVDRLNKKIQEIRKNGGT